MPLPTRNPGALIATVGGIHPVRIAVHAVKNCCVGPGLLSIWVSTAERASQRSNSLSPF